MDLLKSRTFWTILLDVAISLLLHYLGGEDTQFLIVTLQPLALFAIAKFTIDDREKALTTRAQISARTDEITAKEWRAEVAYRKANE
jgi:predicted transcriptional regulator